MCNRLKQYKVVAWEELSIEREEAYKGMKENIKERKRLMHNFEKRISQAQGRFCTNEL
jgi:hypothetical protein